MKHLNRLGALPHKPNTLLKRRRLPMLHMQLYTLPPYIYRKRLAFLALVFQLFDHPASATGFIAFSVLLEGGPEFGPVLLARGGVDAERVVECQALCDGGAGGGCCRRGRVGREVGVVDRGGGVEECGEVGFEGAVGGRGFEVAVVGDVVPVWRWLAGSYCGFF